MMVQTFLLSCKYGKCLISFSLPERLDALRIVLSFVRSCVIVSSISFQEQLKFDCHYSFIFCIGAIQFEVSSPRPIRPLDWFKSFFVDHFERIFQY